MTMQSSVVRTTSTWSIVVVFLLVGAGLVVGLVALAGRTSQQIFASENAMTTTALLQRASKFNVDYSRNVVGPVWDAWDPPSQAIINRADYVDRHAHCPRPGAAPRITGIIAGANGYEVVNESLSGVALHDYWHLVAGQWRFNLALSNPSAVALYREPRAQYFASLGCTK
jgi:hypothetical protein